MTLDDSSTVIDVQAVESSATDNPHTAFSDGQQADEFDEAAGGPSDLQFYPTPEALADRAFAKFQDKKVVRLLDACAGAGALADAYVRHVIKNDRYNHQREWPIDCVEIDPHHHPALRGRNFKLVGLDFLQFKGGEQYSHIIMNPPFASGVHHILRAWDILYSGEVVAILNAETVRNPNSKERRHLAKLIDKFGSVEFIENAFQGDGVERPAQVTIALIHLRKEASESKDWIGPILDALKIDAGHKADAVQFRDLALPASFIENQCIAFDTAVTAMIASVKAEAAAILLGNRIGETMSELNSTGSELETLMAAKINANASWVQGQINKRYDTLKDRAWTSIIRSTDVLSKLSSKVQKQTESEFVHIKQLEFTVSNVRSFLLGLVQSQPEMQIDMVCQIFDEITKYHSDNAVFYRGWKSNDRHRRCGMRVRAKRFILPGHSTDGWRKQLDFDSERQLADFDRVFAMLDGKAEPEVSLVALFRNHFSALRQGERLSSSYFDVRYYPGIGTIHFYPRSVELMDRLNRFVGQRRSWLPPVDADTPAFWEQYRQADKFDAEFRKQVAAGGRSYYHDAFYDARSTNSEVAQLGNAKLVQAMETVLSKHGLLDAIGVEEDRMGIAGQDQPTPAPPMQLPLLALAA